MVKETYRTRKSCYFKGESPNFCTGAVTPCECSGVSCGWYVKKGSMTKEEIIQRDRKLIIIWQKKKYGNEKSL